MVNSNRNYVATLVLDTRGSSDSADATISKVSEIIAGLGGEVKKVENLGSRELSRPQAQGFSEGSYVKIDFQSDPEAPAKVKEKLRLDECVDRILIELA